MRFHPVRRLTREDVADVVALIARRVARLLERRGLAGDAARGEAPDLWSEEAPVLAAVAAASVEGRVALGPRAGAYAGTATHLKKSRRPRWGHVTRTPAGSMCTPG